MPRQSKKEIRAAIEKLRSTDQSANPNSNPAPEHVVGHVQAKKANKQRIRKKGV